MRRADQKKSKPKTDSSFPSPPVCGFGFVDGCTKQSQTWFHPQPGSPPIGVCPPLCQSFVSPPSLPPCPSKPFVYPLAPRYSITSYSIHRCNAEQGRTHCACVRSCLITGSARYAGSAPMSFGPGRTWHCSLRYGHDFMYGVPVCRSFASGVIAIFPFSSRLLPVV